MDNETPIDSSIKSKAVALKRKLEKLINALDNSASVQVVAPAYQWAQSPEMVYLDVKFSHRLDAPGCLEVKTPAVSISEHKITFTGSCARSTQRIKLELDLELYAEIDVEGSDYSFTSVGRLNVNLKKKEIAAWPKPMKGKKPNNVHTWWEMKEKYQELMNAYTGEDDEITQNEKKSPEGMMDIQPNKEL